MGHAFWGLIYETATLDEMIDKQRNLKSEALKNIELANANSLTFAF